MSIQLATFKTSFTYNEVKNQPEYLRYLWLQKYRLWMLVKNLKFYQNILWWFSALFIHFLEKFEKSILA